MQIIQKSLSGLVEIVPTVYTDERGLFLETFNESVYKENRLPSVFKQDNQSFSKKGVVRGLHFQREPHGQGKLVKVITGKVLDVVVDIRPDSATFGQHEKIELCSVRQNMLYVPVGFAHGFVALEDTIFYYKCTNIYNKPAEGGILWNDPTLNIDWQIENPIVSSKDLVLPLFKDISF